MRACTDARFTVLKINGINKPRHARPLPLLWYIGDIVVYGCCCYALRTGMHSRSFAVMVVFTLPVPTIVVLGYRLVLWKAEQLCCGGAGAYTGPTTVTSVQCVQFQTLTDATCHVNIT